LQQIDLAIYEFVHECQGHIKRVWPELAENFSNEWSFRKRIGDSARAQADASTGHRRLGREEVGRLPSQVGWCWSDGCDRSQIEQRSPRRIKSSCKVLNECGMNGRHACQFVDLDGEGKSKAGAPLSHRGHGQIELIEDKEPACQLLLGNDRVWNWRATTRRGERSRSRPKRHQLPGQPAQSQIFSNNDRQPVSLVADQSTSTRDRTHLCVDNVGRPKLNAGTDNGTAPYDAGYGRRVSAVELGMANSQVHTRPAG